MSIDGFSNGPAWSSQRDPQDGPAFQPRWTPADGDGDGEPYFDEDDELDEQIDQAYGEQVNHEPRSGPGGFLRYAVGSASVVVTVLGTWVFLGPVVALVPLAVAGAAVGAHRAARRRDRGAGRSRSGGAGRRQRMAGGGASGGPGGGRDRSRGAGRRAGAGRERGAGAAGGAGRGRNAGAGGRRGAVPAGATAPSRGAGAGRAKPTRGAARGAEPTGGAGRRQALQNTTRGSAARIGKAVSGGRDRSRADSAGRGDRGRGRGGSQTSGAASGGTPGTRRGSRGRGGGRPQTPAVRRTMRQRAARVAGDFGRGLFLIPSYPVRKAGRGARAAGRMAMRSPGVRRLRTHVRQRVLRPIGWSVLRRYARSRMRARHAQNWYLTTWLPRQGRRLTAPARWAGRHLVDDAAWYRSQLAGAGAWATRRRRVMRVRLVRRVRAARARLTPGWWVQLRTLAAINGRGALLLAALAALARRVTYFFRDFLPRWALHGRRRPAPATAAPQPAPVRPAPRPAAAGPIPRSARPGTATAAPRPTPAGPRPMPNPARPTAPAPAAAATPPAGGTAAMPPTTTSGIDIEIPAGVHPSLGRILEASYRCTATWNPLSPVDLHVYLESQPEAIKALSEIHRQFGDRLAATFPGVALVHSFFVHVAHGYAGLQGQAHELFRGWEALHAADLARFRSPRVNEQYSDVARHGVNVANVPVLGNGNRWHANHTVMIEVTRSQLFGLAWGVVEQDKVAELLNWLDSLPLFFDCVARHTLAMGRYLVQNMPVHPGTGDFYRQLARGYIGLADQADELSDGYRSRNRNDADRRERPRVNESWFDFSNQVVAAA